ncbi:hypothetical protein RND81_03G124900 [Saponaria officinalis]|uniref:Smr domain-containing protein n=1 Tax=Saponaria officinalis TaxID=3572 RepID=A0AAW1M033_SAPOF
MSLSRSLSRGTSLNPDAAEFVPFSLRASSGKQILDNSEPSISANSDDDEARQYWQQQLPDDITPDFNVVAEELSLEPLSLHHHTNATPFDDPLSTTSAGNPWDMNLLASEGSSFRGSAKHVIPKNPDVNPVDFLASQFPGFAVESLAEVYFANCCDLNLTFDMLTQLELQVVDGVTNQNMNVKTLSAPNLTSTDFPSLPVPVPDNKTNLPKYTRDELQQSMNYYGSFDKDNLFLFKNSPSLNAKSATDFASAVRKLASQDSGFWKYDKNGSADSAIGSSRSSHALSGLYSSGAGRSFSDKMQGRGSSRAAPLWLETGDAVANLYSDVREEARDRARLRNTYFEQARQAYLVGNKALAKELSVKGHLHNMQMKAAHCKAGESIYRERNAINSGLQGGGRCQEKMIDLHGLHVNEAIHVLKQELNVLRNAARLGDQRLHVYICVGTGHHTRGTRTPARLPIAVQRYLLQEEGLEYTEPQPGLLRVVLF